MNDLAIIMQHVVKAQSLVATKELKLSYYIGETI